VFFVVHFGFAHCIALSLSVLVAKRGKVKDKCKKIKGEEGIFACLAALTAYFWYVNRQAGLREIF